MRKTGKIGNGISTFGSLQPQRSQNAGAYRYSFNSGSEKDDEITGVDGAHYTTDFRMLDTRLGGRWWSVDPIVKPWESPYVGFANNPIWFTDPDGADPKKRAERFKKKYGGEVIRNSDGSYSVDRQVGIPNKKWIKFHRPYAAFFKLLLIS